MTTRQNHAPAAAHAPAKGRSTRARTRAAAPTPPKKPTALTTSLNAKVAATLPPWDKDPERPFATGRLLYAFPADFEIPGPTAAYPAWSLKAYSRFLDPDDPQPAPPPSVNPSLWRNALLNMNAGLYEVVPDAVYQVRGADLSNISFLEDPTGTGDVIVVDPLVSEECAAEALSTYLRIRADGVARRIIAVIYTHSHVDHYGGVRGLFGPDGPDGAVEFIAPEGFLDHAVSENVYAGAAMSHRAVFMYGVALPRDILGQVDAGLGKTTSTGTTGLIAPTITITDDTSSLSNPLRIGNFEFVFQLTPNTEAPAEMNFYLPQCRALCIAENATPTMHNIYSLRGAQVRDAKAWSEYLNDAAARFGPITDTLFASHFWPRWNNPDDPDGSVITDFLTSQADLYRFLHDQTLRRSNKGDTMLEVAEDLDQHVPPSLAGQWFNRGYYGTVSHNVKAVYQRYLGWFDGNPPHLHSLPPDLLGQRYVKAMGGPDNAVAIAKEAFANAKSIDDYRWAAQLAGDVVFGWPEHTAARELEADVLEQLGYLAESGPWRNFYLAGALELRAGDPPPKQASMITLDMIAAMSLKQVFDYIGIRLDAVQNTIQTLSIGLAVTTEHDGAKPAPCWLRTRNSVVVFTQGAPEAAVDASYEITRDGLNRLALGEVTPQNLVDDGQLTVLVGSLDTLNTFNDYLDVFTTFPIALPGPPYLEQAPAPTPA